MSIQKKESSIIVEQDIPFQKKLWLFQKIGWLTMGFLLFLALLGIFGHGPISSANTESSDQELTASFDRFLHIDSPEKLTITVNNPEEKKAKIWLSAAFLNNTEIREMDPETSNIAIDGDTVIYSYDLRNRKTFSLSIKYSPNVIGTLNTKIGLIDGPEMEIKQFVYP